MNPDYISCTYGAGGSNAGRNVTVLYTIKKSPGVTPITHCACVGNTKEGIRDQLTTYLGHNIEADISFQRQKQDEGADFITAQLL